MAYQSQNTSPWMALQSIKRQLRETELKQTSMITAICGGDDMNLSNQTCVGASGNIYHFDHVSGGAFSLVANLYDDVTDTWSAINPLTNADINTFLDYEGTEISTTTILNDIKEGMEINALIADICNVFQTGSTLSVSDVYSLLDDSEASIVDKSKLKTYIKGAVVDGKISSQSWLSIIQAMAKVGKDATDDDTVIMDTSSPFAIQAFASSIVQATTTILTTIASAINVAFGAIIMLIGQLASTIMNFINQSVSNVLIGNPESSTYYVKGPIKYCYGYGPEGIKSPYDEGILCDHFGPWDIYSWLNQQDENKVDCNAFINIGFDVIKAIQRIQNWRDNHPYWTGTISYNSEGYTGSIRWNPDGVARRGRGDLLKRDLYTDPDLYLSQEECLAILCDNNKLTRYIGLLIAFDSCLSWYNDNSTSGSTTSEMLQYYYGTAFSGVTAVPNGQPVTKTNTDNFVRMMIRLFVVPVVYHDYQPNLDDFGTVASWTSYIQNWYRDNVIPLASTPQDRTISVAFSSDTKLAKNRVQSGPGTGTLSDAAHFKFVGDVLYGWCTGTYLDLPSDVRVPCENIPIDRAITVPDITQDTAIAVLTMVGIALSAITVGKTLVGRALAKRSTAKQLAARRNLSELRRQYNEAPNDSTKYDAYWKAIRRFNLKASLLGWKRYDPINDWYDNPSSNYSGNISSSNASIPNTLKNTQTLLQGVSNINGSLPSMENNLSGDSNLIYKAITGNDFPVT